MKSTKVSLDMERQIITNLIVSKQYCTAVLPMLQPKYFKTKYAKVVSMWIREYHTRYEDAPGELIQSIFHEKKDSLTDSEEVDSISEFLISLSDEYDEKKNLHNIDYTIEQAIKYLKLRSIELLKEDLDKALSEGEPVKGEAVIANYSRVGKPEGDTIDILHNKMDIIDAFTQEDEILFNLPGVLKQTVGPFRRGDLSAWIGPPKGRKCSLKGTKVLLSTGQLKNIEDIVPGEDQVLAMDEDYRLVNAPVSHLHVNGIQKTYKVTVRTGQSIDITDNHPLFKFMDGWTSISRGLKVGDYIALPVIYEEDRGRFLKHLISCGYSVTYEELENLIDGDIYFSPIISIEYTGENETFDITVPKYHNFIGNGIVSHNSFALMFVAEQALWAGCRVVFFSLEMRKPQLIRRAWQAWNGQPVRDMIVDIPRFELISGTPGNELFAIENDKKKKTAIDLTDIENVQDKIRKRFGGGDVRFIALPAYSATVEDIISHLDNLTWYEDFVPDVVIIDYADIVKPSRYSGTEYRHQLDSIWKGLRALAQTRNIHVCTASQTNRAGMRGDIELEHIAEDMRKLTHVSLLLALNQKPEEREINALRIKTLLNRDDGVLDSNEAVVLQQLALGKFYLDSRLRKEVEKTDVTD